MTRRHSELLVGSGRGSGAGSGRGRGNSPNWRDGRSTRIQSPLQLQVVPEDLRAVLAEIEIRQIHPGAAPTDQLLRLPEGHAARRQEAGDRRLWATAARTAAATAATTAPTTAATNCCCSCC